MSKIVKTHLPCPDCGSSDALTQYVDGTYCFSCGAASATSTSGEEGHTTIKMSREERFHLTKDLKYDTLTYSNKKEEEEDTLELSTSYLNNSSTSMFNSKVSTIGIDTLNIKDIKLIKDYRKLNTKTLEFYKVLFTNDVIKYPYRKGEGYKCRILSKKEFFTEGDMKVAGLFGKELFAPGGKALTITEGENDAMAVYQMNGGFPSVSVRSSVHAVMDCKADFEYINSFDKIYLAFDNDEVGYKAMQSVAALFNPNKVYQVKLSKYKDPHQYLESDDVVFFNKEWWNSKPYLPKGIVGDYSSIEEIFNQESAKPVATYPYQKLQDMTYGIRLGEVVLLTAQEKIGKTEILRSIEYHLLKTTDYNLGIIHLEESEKRTLQGLVGYELKRPVHLPDSGVSSIEALNTFKEITKRDNRCFLYKHFGSDDPDVILSTIRYLVAVCDCKFIFLDHITMLVTGYQGDDERKKLDYLSTQLAMLTRELNFTLFLISHVNDDGKTRGSRNISKIADLIVYLDRDIEAATIDQRNKTHLLIKGNRWAGISGPSSTLFFDQGTFTLQEVESQTVDQEDNERDSETTKSSDNRLSSLWAQASEQG